MYSQLEFSFDQAKQIADIVVFQSTKKHLTDPEVEVLQGAWHGKTYNEIAQNLGFSSNYIQNDIGAKLWRKLTESLGEEITKKNFRQALYRAWENRQSSPLIPLINSLENPYQPVPLNSSFYIQRYLLQSQNYTIESFCYHAIAQPTAILRIKAPRQMGKTSLLDRILAQAHNYGYRTVRLNFLNADQENFNNIDNFLRWFCVYIGHELELKNCVNDFWQSLTIGSKVNCKSYLKNYLLKQIDQPLLLALDEVDWIFNYSQISQDFFSLLRTCYEEANNENIWQKLRLVITHSTENYGLLDINHSPFNVGESIELTEFTPSQIKDLAQRHQLKEIDDLVTQIITMVGGHPYLVRVALYHLVKPESENLTQLWENAPTDHGIYNSHLRPQLDILRTNQRLSSAFKQVINHNQPVSLDSGLGYQLYSMGLIKWQNNQVIPRCLLYQKYFSARLE